MAESTDNQQQSKEPFSDMKHGGILLPAVLATAGFGVVLYGLFTGSSGLYGDSQEVTFSDGLYEFWRELVRIVVFSLLLLTAVRINCWRLRVPLGKVLLAALRCLAIVVLIEAVRVLQLEHNVSRLILISMAQFVICAAVVVLFFTSTIRDAIVFTLGCTVGVVLLWLGAHVGIWII
jgi:hypothetical protein